MKNRLEIHINLGVPSRKDSRTTRKKCSVPVEQKVRDAMTLIESDEDSAVEWGMLVRLNNRLAAKWRQDKLNKRELRLLSTLQSFLLQHRANTDYDIDHIPSLVTPNGGR